MDQHQNQTPTPRDYEEPTFSELIPFKSTQINVLKSPVMWLVGLSGLATIVLYSGFIEFFSKPTIEGFMAYGLTTIGFLLLILLGLFYLYSRTDRPVWHFIVPMIVVYLALKPPAWDLYVLVFRSWMNPQWVGGPSVFNHFIFMFSGAGLLEELLKNTGTLLGALLLVKYAHLREKNPAIFDALVIRGPLDGLLMGIVGGAMFIFLETGFEYFPNQFAQNASPETLLSGLMLLLPRTISGAVGHMGWAGIFGYFIGLWVIRPATWKYMLYAWIGVSLLHAGWNTSSYFDLLKPLTVGATAVMLVACLLKARQINMNLGRALDTYGSIVVMPGDRPTAELMPLTTAPKTIFRNANVGNKPDAVIVIGDARMPVFAGRVVDFDPSRKAGIDTSGLEAEITRHPTRPDVIGLKNVGAKTWTAILRDGKRIEMLNGRNIRLAPGVQIDFGVGPIASVEPG